MNFEEWIESDEGVVRFGMQLSEGYLLGARAGWEAAIEQRRCGTCRYRKIGSCMNIKLAEDIGQSDFESQDMLLYEYEYHGDFWVGERFGCVHYESLEMEDKK